MTAQENKNYTILKIFKNRNGHHKTGKRKTVMIWLV